MTQVRLIDGSRSTYRLDLPLVNPYTTDEILRSLEAWGSSSDAPTGFHALVFDDTTVEFASGAERSAWLCGFRQGASLASPGLGHDQ